MYSVGDHLRISLFGKSHAECIGCIIEGLPMGMEIDSGLIEKKMSLRKPTDKIGTPRKEDDTVVFEHGVSNGKVSGKQVMLVIENKNTKSSDYSELVRRPRPGHADLPALIRGMDIEGGAQFSGRMTAPLVAAGSIAEQYLLKKGIRIAAYTRSVYDIVDESEHGFEMIVGSQRYPTRAVSEELDSMIRERITSASSEGDSVGGVIRCVATGLDIGLGGMWFDALDVSVARMLFSIPAVKGVQFGKGFEITKMKGSESNDQYSIKDGKIVALSNNMGGVCGGMSDGMPLVVDVAVKPTPSISKQQRTVDLGEMKDATLCINGRHDPCIVPRAVPVVESMVALSIMDQYLSMTL